MNGLKEIARQIQNLIDQQVEMTVQEDSSHKYNFEEVAHRLYREIEDAKELVAEMNENQLTLNSIETEGFLRGLITAYSIMQQHNGDIEDLPVKS